MRDEDLWPVVQATGGAPTRHVEMAIEECDRRAKTYRQLVYRMREELRRRENDVNRRPSREEAVTHPFDPRCVCMKCGDMIRRARAAECGAGTEDQSS